MIANPRTKGPRKHKTEVLGILLPGGGIKYATDHDRETMKGVPTGTPIALRTIGDSRNLKHHRKFWKLLELGYQYWEPAWSFVSAPESWIAHSVAKELATAAGDLTLYENVTKGIAEGVLAKLAGQRQLRFDAEAVKTDE